MKYAAFNDDNRRAVKNLREHRESRSLEFPTFAFEAGVVPTSTSLPRRLTPVLVAFVRGLSAVSRTT